MFVLIWTALLFSADPGESVEEITSCVKDVCITLSKGEITAEAGLCVVIPCSFTTADGFTPQHMIWYKCEPSKSRCGDADIIFQTYKNNSKVQSEFLGRVSLLEPEVKQKNCSIIINNLTESDSGSYQLRVKGLNYWRDEGFTFSSRATVSVKGLTQKPSVLVPLTEGQQTTLTCTAPGLCSGSDPEITWTWRGAVNITAATHSSTLTFNPSAEHHGTNVTCKVSFSNNITTEETVTLNVTYDPSLHSLAPSLLGFPSINRSLIFPKLLNVSACEVQSGVLTCVCTSEGFPLPSITWPLLETHDEYSVTTNKSSHTVISITVSVKDRNYTTVECVSSNEHGEAKENIAVRVKESKQDDLLYTFLILFIQPQVIIAFVIGILLSATICCLAVKCCRSKQKNSGDVVEALEMVTTQAVPLIDGTHDQEESEEGAQAAGQSAPNGDVEPREVEYSDINFSLVKRKSPTGAEDEQETTDTEYAEIKNKETEEGRDDGAEDSGGREEEEVMGEDEEAKQCMPKEEGGDDVAVYSNVNEIMGEEEKTCSLVK